MSPLFLVTLRFEAEKLRRSNVVRIATLILVFSRSRLQRAVSPRCVPISRVPSLPRPPCLCTARVGTLISACVHRCFPSRYSSELDLSALGPLVESLSRTRLSTSSVCP